MYGRVLTRSTSARVVRAKPGMIPTPTAIATGIVPNPSAVTIASASSSPGMARKTSTTRMVTASTAPPAKPETTPSVRPATRAMPIASAVAAIVRVEPWTTREYRSRPSSSVPNQCARLGGSSRSAGAVAVGS